MPWIEHPAIILFLDFWTRMTNYVEMPAYVVRWPGKKYATLLMASVLAGGIIASMT
ncbi:hypothetical protein BH23CHL5_BH23CHL5_20270 [soil metagenome]